MRTGRVEEAQRREPTREALEMLLDVAGEARARRILLEVGTRSAQLDLERVLALRITARMLAAREDRSVVRERLIARGHSERTAYRLLVAAADIADHISANDGRALAETQETLGAIARKDLS